MKPPVLSKALEAAFERLMKAYPPRGDNPRTPAKAAFAALVAAGEDAEALVQAAARFAEAMKAEKRERRMIPHTRTWLSQRRFDDYLADDPASSDEGQANPDHPLAFLEADIGAAAFRSWIAPLKVTLDPPLGVVVTVQTAFALNHIRKARWDQAVAERLGDVTWRVG